MVDLQTAMAAAQASERRSKGGRGASDEKKKRRSGSDMGIEPFDPVKYVGKEIIILGIGLVDEENRGNYKTI